MIPAAALADLIATRTGQGSNPTQRDRATWTRCRHCHAWTLTGLDNPVMALTARTDPTPLDPRTELAALLAGRATYRLHLRPHPHLRLRDHHQIQGSPPRPDLIVLPEHACHRQLAASLDRLTVSHREEPHVAVPF